MKILQVAHYYGSLGGIERVVHQFCHALKDLYDVEALVCNEHFQTESCLEDGIPVTRVGRIAHIKRMSVCPTFPVWLRSKKPDLVHVHMINPLAEISFLLSGLKCKVIATYHMDLSRHRFLSLIYTPLQRRFLERLDLVTASSENFALSSPVLSRYRNKLRILPFGISRRSFQETDATRRAAERLREEIPGKVVLFVGRLIYYKGLDVLVEAMRTVEATCLIIGDGYLQSSLRKKIRSSGLDAKIRVLGRVRDEELLAYYDRADLFVLPSVTRTESYGLTQLEAMSRKTPVVCTELGTGTSFVNRHGETGLVVPPGDPKSLADAMNRILTDENLARRFSENAFRRIREVFSEEKMVKDLRRIYREVLGE